jgi:hypothetical protein
MAKKNTNKPKAPARKTGTMKVRIVRSLWGDYKMPYKVGQEVALKTAMAKDLIETGHAEKI